ncbi:DeoR family transcriptional regulator [Pontibacillus salipaludis]|uniref:HTH-type transcriptional repressor YcnK n=1 Tax=Pontibacillus salipaludis TaxID=1697394 RepID=A0ABQ1Q1Q0_9BACI|nr:DeoR family transcriptional regulator [Pontibacillus salipaludis]GGD10604.1 HTH-type transcriptional repressor YcnK [Pontibacillus salipaludis]
MLPVDRLKKIKEWLDKEESLRVSDVSTRLGVSEMTIYRDLKPLLDRKEVVKTSNGFALAPPSPSHTDTNYCSFCHKHNGQQQSVQLFMRDQPMEKTCCMHCGLLRYEHARGEVTQILCKDTLLQTTISAIKATYIVDSELPLRCCQPQVLPFETKEHALKFKKGFGGKLCSFDEALQMIHVKMGSCH